MHEDDFERRMPATAAKSDLVLLLLFVFTLMIPAFMSFQLNLW